MNRRKAHAMPVLKTCDPAKTPQHILCVDTETHTDTPDAEVMIQGLTLGWVIYGAASDGWQQWAAEFRTAGEFWDQVERRAHGEVLWVVGHNLGGFDIMVLEWERELTARGWLCDSIPIDKPFMAAFSHGPGRRIQLIDLGNYYGIVTLKSIGAKMDLPKGDPAGGVVNACYHPANGCVPGSEWWQELSRYCLRDAEIVFRGFVEYIQFAIEKEIPWRLTTPAMSMAAFRYHFLNEEEIWLHNNEKVTQLERDSYHGALTDCFRLGDSDGWDDNEGLYCKLDVNSMYPSVMTDYCYPSKLKHYLSAGTLAFIDGEHTDAGWRVSVLKKMLADDHCVVARVRVNTERCAGVDKRELAITPKMTTKLKYVIGRYTAAVTTRELERLLSYDVVEDVLEVAVYEQRDLFSEYVAWFYEMKTEYGRNGNKIWKDIAKLYLNGLYGKWGQQKELWDDCEAVLDDGVFVEKCTVIMPSERVKQYTIRQFMGRAVMSDGVKAVSANSFIAIAAHITADARVRLMEYRRAAGFDNCYYADTDSLVMNACGMERCVSGGLVDEERLGALKIESSAPGVVITTLKDYQFGDEVHMKGVRRDAEEIKPNVFEQVQFRKLSGATRGGDLNRAMLRNVTKHFARSYDKGTVEGNGWIMPETVTEAI